MTIAMCTSGSVYVKCGAKLSSGMFTSGVAIQRAIEHGQSYVNAATMINFNTQYATLDGDKKAILEDAVSSHAAGELINYDMSNFTSRQEAVQMINFNWATRDAAIGLLKNKEVSEDFIGGV